MSTPAPPRIGTRCVLTLALLLSGSITHCVGALSSKPGVFEVHVEELTLPNSAIHLTLAKPVHPRTPLFLVVFATGDAGWIGASGDIALHMAEQGYYLAAFNSREVVKNAKQSDGTIDPSDAAADVDSMIAQAKSALGLPESTGTIVTGDSRGATFVVYAAGHPLLQRDIVGAVAVALTREVDHMRPPPPEQLSATIQVDDKGRIQTYPAIPRLGSIPIAVIQSTNDKYVPSAESRRLMGPDTPTRRLYEVESRNHGFGGGREQLLRDLDDALGWIEGLARAGRGSAG